MKHINLNQTITALHLQREITSYIIPIRQPAASIHKKIKRKAQNIISNSY
ncbi:MAG: hypothetical protein L3J74_18570 [Bacteroidales bacterium]|nr:hypothetical protein [Bacteroidales bacterium]